MKIKIVSKREPYFRAGLAHTKAGTFHSAESITDKQREILDADPMLTLIEVADEKEVIPPLEISAADSVLDIAKVAEESKPPALIEATDEKEVIPPSEISVDDAVLNFAKVAEVVESKPSNKKVKK